MNRTVSWNRLPDPSGAQALLHQLRLSEPLQRRTCMREPVVLYGAGELGQLAMAWCRQHDVEVLAVVDAGAERWRGHDAWGGVAVLSPTEVPASWHVRHPLLVCISTLPYVPLANQLLSQGWQRLQPFYDFVYAWPAHQPMNNGWHADIPNGAAAAAMETVLTAWSDDVSRAHHLQFMAWRCRREEWQFDGAPIRPDERYFPPEMLAAFRPGERILDGGAHHGQVLARWMTTFPGWLDRAWGVEPDYDNMLQLRRWWSRLPTHEQQRIELQEIALDRRSGQRAFTPGQGYGSRIWGNGSHLVPVQSIDSLGISPSFVKLHLEGGEWRALQGASRTLAQCRPLLALTVYHRRDGLWPTAHWLMRQLPDYRWLFRLHGWLGTAALIYGVPVERCSS